MGNLIVLFGECGNRLLTASLTDSFLAFETNINGQVEISAAITGGLSKQSWAVWTCLHFFFSLLEGIAGFSLALIWRWHVFIILQYFSSLHKCCMRFCQTRNIKVILMHKHNPNEDERYLFSGYSWPYLHADSYA